SRSRGSAQSEPTTSRSHFGAGPHRIDATAIPAGGARGLRGRGERAPPGHATAMKHPRYYLRVRGVGRGPFDLGHLQSMRRLGGLARFHEVSPDGQTWAPAETLVDVFQPPSPRTAPPERSRPQEPATVDPVAAPAPAQAPPTVPDRWYYAEAGQPVGP